MQCAGEKKHGPVLFSLVLAGLALLPGPANDQEAGPPPSAREVTGGVHMYDELFAACSPDGGWLAFEYHEPGDPNYPHVGIMDLSQDSHPWHPLLNGKPGWHLYAGDLSWSPDSRWLALIIDYPEGRKSFWSDSHLQVVKVDINAHNVVRLTNFPPNTHLGPTTAWLRSGLIVFPGADENIYGVSESGGDVRRLVNVPAERCGGGTNTLAVSPDEKRVAFAMDEGGDSQIAECNALWIADFRTDNLRRVPTTGLRPLGPVWVDGGTILFAGIHVAAGKWSPVGMYSLSLSTAKVTRLLKGPYLPSSLCDSGKTLYFSWGSRLQDKTPAAYDWPTFNDFYGFHIWKVPLRDVLP